MNLRQLPAAILLGMTGLASAAPFAYVPNEKSGTLSVIDTATDTVARTITTGGKPRGTAVSPDGKTVYVSEQTGNALLVIDAASGKTVQRIGLGESPEGIDLSFDGKLVAAASELSNGVILVDTGPAHATTTIKVPGPNPEHAVFSPDGRQVYVGAENGSQVDVIDVAARQVVASVAVGRRPRGIAFAPDGRTAWVACELDGTLYAIDTAARKASGPGTWRSRRTARSSTWPTAARARSP